VSEAGGKLLDLLGAMGDITKLLNLSIHDTLRHVVLTEGLGELLLGDALGVLMGVTVAVPPRACSTSELVGSHSHTLLVRASDEVQLLLHLAQPVLGDDGVIIGTVKGRGPQLEETL
jgi:hypothetical protein